MSLEEPCTTLYNHKLVDKGFKAATNYVTTARLKKLKHMPHVNVDNEKYDYCYFDYDKEFKNIDPLMEGEDCSKINSVFYDIPFISDVYIDKHMEDTRFFPYNKCVIKIDKEKARNTEHLQQFWERVETIDCKQQVREINMKIVSITEELDMCQEKLKQAKHEYNDLVKQAKDLESIIIEKESTLNACLKNLQVLREELSIIDHDLKQRNKQYETTKKDCESKILHVQTKASKCENDFKSLKSKHDNEVLRNKTLQSQLQSNVSKFQLNSIAQTNLKEQHQSLKTYKDKLNESIFQLTQEYNSIYIEWTNCNTQFTECQKKLSLSRSNTINLQEKYTKCLKQYYSCKTDLERCLAFNAEKTKVRNDLMDIHKLYSNEYNHLLDENFKLEKRKSELTSLLEWLRNQKNVCDTNATNAGIRLDGIKLQQQDIAFESEAINDNRKYLSKLKLGETKTAGEKTIECTANATKRFPVHCQVSGWSEWTPCSASCGTGTTTRSREIIMEPRNGGDACPVLEETEPCSSSPCFYGCYNNEAAFGKDMVYLSGGNYSSAANFAKEKGKKYIAISQTAPDTGFVFAFNDEPNKAYFSGGDCKFPCHNDSSHFCGCGDYYCGYLGQRQWSVYFVG